MIQAFVSGFAGGLIGALLLCMAAMLIVMAMQR